MKKASGSSLPPSRLRAIGRALRDARANRTQREIGLILGVPQTTIVGWKHGQIDLRIDKLRSIEKKLGLSPDHLLRAGSTAGSDGRL